MKNSVENKFLKPDLFQYRKDNKLTTQGLKQASKKLNDINVQLKEGFVSGRLPVKNEYAEPSWGFGPSSVNKKDSITILF